MKYPPGKSLQPANSPLAEVISKDPVFPGELRIGRDYPFLSRLPPFAPFSLLPFGFYLRRNLHSVTYSKNTQSFGIFSAEGVSVYKIKRMLLING